MASSASSAASVFPKSAIPKKTVLVTGGSGFIGSHVVAAYRSAGCAVRVLDLVPTDAAPCRVGDVADPTAVRKAVDGIDLVIHLAAQASVQKAIAQPELTRRSNVDGTRVVLEEARKAGCPKIVFASSCAVYGDQRPPVDESMPVRPLSLYSETKVAGERLCESFSKAGPTCVALRFFNVYGPGQARDSDYSAVIPAFIHAAKNGSDLTVYGDGTQSRDFVYVGDVVRAIQNAAAYPEPFGLFNVGSGRAVSVLDLARNIIRLTGSSSKIVHAPMRRGEIRYSWANPRLAESQLGFRPATDLDAGLRSILDGVR